MNASYALARVRACVHVCTHRLLVCSFAGDPQMGPSRPEGQDPTSKSKPRLRPKDTVGMECWRAWAPEILAGSPGLLSAFPTRTPSSFPLNSLRAWRKRVAQKYSAVLRLRAPDDYQVSISRRSHHAQAKQAQHHQHQPSPQSPTSQTTPASSAFSRRLNRPHAQTSPTSSELAVARATREPNNPSIISISRRSNHPQAKQPQHHQHSAAA